MMRFGFSNLVMPRVSEVTRTALLDASTVCDFAPTVHYGGWSQVPDSLPLQPYPGSEVRIGALQSLMFGIEGASLVKDDRSFGLIRQHLARLVNSAGDARIPYLIYGSPGTRANRAAATTDQTIKDRVVTLANDSHAKGVQLCFEVNSPKFGCEFLSDNRSLFELLNELRHPGLALHLDVGQMLEEGIDPIETVAAQSASLVHLHLSAPDFTCRPDLLPLYRRVISALSQTASGADVVLEVQTLGAATEAQLVQLAESLAAEFSR